MKTVLRVSLALWLLASLASPQAAAQARVTLAATCPPPVPGFFACELMAGLGRLIPQNLANVEATVQRNGSFPDTARSIAEGRADLGILGSVSLLEFLDEFRGRPFRTLTPMGNLFVYHLVTLEETGIRSIADLRGKRVAVDPPTPAANRDAMRFLTAAGIDPDRDIRRESLPLGTWTAALREKRIDAAFAISTGSLVEPGILELATTPGVRIRLIPLDILIPSLEREFRGRYLKGAVRKVYYPGMTDDVPTIVAAVLIVTTQALSTDLAYQITKLIYEKRAELAQIHPAAQHITLIGIAERPLIPFHPGAVLYFKERGAEGF